MIPPTLGTGVGKVTVKIEGAVCSVCRHWHLDDLFCQKGKNKIPKGECELFEDR